jgi:hypothetical protein
MAAETTDRHTDTDGPPLASGLAGYVRAVATELGVTIEATGYEISDTVTVYIGLTERCSGDADHDLMLVWTERRGWYVAAETNPTEPALVLGYFGDADLVPSPVAVARFVSDVLAGRHPPGARPLFPAADNRRTLATLLQPFQP